MLDRFRPRRASTELDVRRAREPVDKSAAVQDPAAAGSVPGRIYGRVVPLVRSQVELDLVGAAGGLPRGAWTARRGRCPGVLLLYYFRKQSSSVPSGGTYDMVRD